MQTTWHRASHTLGVLEMAFTEVTKGVFASKPAAVNSVRVYGRPSCVKIVISSDILAKLGEPMFFRAAVGSGKHAGFIALIPARAKSGNTYKVNPRMGCIGISPKAIGIARSTFKTTAVPHEITDDGLVLDIRAFTKAPAIVAAA